MEKLVLATRNPGKTKEIQDFLNGLPVQVESLEAYPDCPDSEEPYDTYVENARDKARLVAQYCQAWALADDSGLEITALGGRPGVYSARYAGEKASYEDNWRKVLQEMKGIPESERGAVFRCCMVLVHPDGREFVSEGILEGQITTEAHGEHGFGYDPIFWVPPLGKTLAELSLEEKNQLSHRHLALVGMLSHLKMIFGLGK